MAFQPYKLISYDHEHEHVNGTYCTHYASDTGYKTNILNVQTGESEFIEQRNTNGSLLHSHELLDGNRNGKSIQLNVDGSRTISVYREDQLHGPQVDYNANNDIIAVKMFMYDKNISSAAHLFIEFSAWKLIMEAQKEQNSDKIQAVRIAFGL